MGKKSKKFKEKKKQPKKAQKKVEKVKKEKKQKKEKVHFILNRLLGTVILSLSIVLLSFVGIFLYLKIFGPVSLAALLPQEKTVLFFETNFNSANGVRFFELFKDKEPYSKENLILKIEEYLNVDFKTDIKHWLGGRIGIGILKSAEENQTTGILFIETINKEQTIEFLKKLSASQDLDQIQTNNYKKKPIYTLSLSKNFYSTFLNKYLVLSPDEKTLHEIIDSASQKTQLLRKSKKYLDIKNNLPTKQLAFGYIDTKNAIQTIENSEWIEDLGVSLAILKPVLRIFPAGGVSITAQPKGLFVQTYVSVNKKDLKDEAFFHYDEKYRPKLTSLVEKDMLIFAGGHDLVSKTKRLLEIFNEVHPTAALLTEGALRAKKTEYFGEEISLENDIYPFFENEYALVINKNKKGNYIAKLLLELKDPKQAEKNITKIKDEFLDTRAFLKPKIEEVTLESGEKQKEIVGIHGSLNEETSEHKGAKITSITTPSQDFTIFYTIFNKTFILSNDLESIKASIDLRQNKKDSLRASKLYESLRQVNRTADEVFTINLSELKDLPKYLKPFKSISSGKNIFDDGISTINFLEVE